MAGDDEPGDEIAAGESGDKGAEEAEALIDLLRSEAGGPVERIPGPEPGRPAAQSAGRAAQPPGDEAAVRAVIRAMPDKNEVILGLVNIKEPVNRTSISLSADTTVRLGERLLLEALNLPDPPDPKVIRTTLARLLKALEKSQNGNA